MTKEAEYGSVVAHVVPHSRIVAKKKSDTRHSTKFHRNDPT
jgi:hypothetical protein